MSETAITVADLGLPYRKLISPKISPSFIIVRVKSSPSGAVLQAFTSPFFMMYRAAPSSDSLNMVSPILKFFLLTTPDMTATSLSVRSWKKGTSLSNFGSTIFYLPWLCQAPRSDKTRNSDGLYYVYARDALAAPEVPVDGRLVEVLGYEGHPAFRALFRNERHLGFEVRALYADLVSVLEPELARVLVAYLHHCPLEEPTERLRLPGEPAGMEQMVAGRQDEPRGAFFGPGGGELSAPYGRCRCAPYKRR